jgi:hypothetical protein
MHAAIALIFLSLTGAAVPFFPWLTPNRYIRDNVAYQQVPNVDSVA